LKCSRDTGCIRFSVLDGVAGDGMSKKVAVPSRRYAQPPNDSQPLAGMRISIKDNFQLAGVKTTNLSRSFSELYPPDGESADYVKELLKLGAIVLGKTKMSAFASSDEPTDQWIDYHCPFNPRGDGYQSPSGSSAGAAVSVAGYDWLDISIGTDSKFA
jgi:Asp-tRNA(Asn)/Glu-tRNA(Gln) amidotransferase A subunit family amidase